MAYTAKIYDFASKFEWASALDYDLQHRNAQAVHGFMWGTPAAHLELHVLNRCQALLQKGHAPSWPAGARAATSTPPHSSDQFKTI